MRGSLEVAVWKMGPRKLVHKIIRPNLILNQCYVHLQKILAGDDAANQYANRMQFGTGLAAPTVTDTLLQVPIAPTKAITTIAYPSASSVRFDAYLLVGEGNGFPISEAGLMSPNGELIARAVFTPQLKTADYQFEFRWTIQC